MITQQSDLANEETFATNNTWGIIKDKTIQLKDGYLNKTPIFQYMLLSICFPMWGIAASLKD